MAFSGDISDFSLIEVVQIISSSGRTGRLNINGKIVKTSVIFDDGKPVQTIPVHSSVLLGQLLIRAEEIDQVGLEVALKIQKSHKRVGDDKQLGRILFDLGLVDSTTLNKFLLIQIKDSFYDILSERKGTFDFVSIDHPKKTDVDFTIDIFELLLYGMRQIETRSKIKDIISSDDIILEKTPNVNSTDIGSLGVDERSVYSVVDGVKTVAEILATADMAQLNVIEALYQLIKKSYIKIPNRYFLKNRK